MILLLFLLVLLIFVINSISNFESKKSLFFVHIPKNAGTSIEELFKKYNYKLGRYHLTESINNVAKWHYPPKYMKEYNYSNYITFCVVREPISRFVSAVNYRISYFNENIPDINVFTKYVLSPNVDKLHNFDCHFLPQSEYLYDSYGNKIKNILRFSHLEEDLKRFIKKYKLSVVYSNTQENVNNNKFKVSDLNEESLNLIKQYYFKDFLLNF